MALGFAKDVLLHLKQLNPENYSGDKVTMPGMLAALLAQPNRPNVIETTGLRNGHTRGVAIKYRQRSTEAQVETELSCDPGIVPAWKETTASVDYDAQIGIHIPNDTIRQYQEEASQTVKIGKPASSMMSEFVDGTLAQLNGLYQHVNRRGLTYISANPSVNARVGSAASQNVNIPLTGTSNNLNEGMGRIIADAQINEFCGDNLYIVGSGNFHMHHIQRMANAVGPNQSGINHGNLSAALGYEFYYDRMSASVWGDNQIYVIDRNAMHFIQWEKNVGSFAGQHGAVTLAQWIDPRVQCWTPAGYKPLQFDVKLKYIDCPTTLTNAYTGNSGTFNEGWAAFISLTFGFFVQPNDLFDGADPMAGNRGYLRYTITNA